MNERKRLYGKIIALICSVALAFSYIYTSAYAWFYDATVIRTSVTGTAHRNYFESGNGSEISPFEIRRPVQLYYLAWLQSMGYFNKPQNGSDEIKQYYFYLSADLDMSSYTLPPIGTISSPFLGNFDGRGHIVSNLTVTNEDEEYNDVPQGDADSEVQIVGFFGVVGSYNEAAGTVTAGGNVYSYNSAVNSIGNFLLDGANLITKKPLDDKTLIGIAAGYVNGDVDTVMNCVGIYNCTVSVAKTGLAALAEDITDKISAYSLVGYSRGAYEAYVNSLGPEGDNWGGSVDMKSAHDRLSTAYVTGNATTNRINYTYRVYRNFFYDEYGNQVGDPVEDRVDTANYKYKDYDSTGGSFLFALRGANAMSGQYFYLNGGVRIADTRYYYEDTTGYVISDNTGTYFLTAAGTSVIDSAEGGTVWLYSDGKIYYEEVEYQATSAIKRYLGTENGKLVVTLAEKNWNYAGNGIYSENEYVVHINGAYGGWGVTDNNLIMKITDGTYYLGNLSDISSTVPVASAAAAEWLVSDGFIHTVINDDVYYLNRSGNGITISASPVTKWSVGSGGISADGYALRCHNGNWTLVQTPLYIKDASGCYLTTVNGTSFLNDVTVESSASEWILSVAQTGYYVSTVVGGVTYYLRNNGGVLSLTDQSSLRTEWTI